MDYNFSELAQRTRDWGDNAREAGWLMQRDCDRIAAVEERSPSSLFKASEQRPLVVSFFGGTGVGKSSLLNRLAKQTIARTGVVRPTSREVSVYLHQSVHIDELPAEFPVDKIRVAHHRDDDLKDILWIDMPDIDSTEQTNRKIVLEWLPHIDVLVYVVSPERYRDDKGWRLLQSQGEKHAWLFIMNQWDKGQETQIDDFTAELGEAGFKNPITLRTDCSEPAEQRNPDDFDKLQETIQSLADANTIKQLELRGVRLRLQGLSETIGQCIKQFGDVAADATIDGQWGLIWRDASEQLTKGLQWPVKQIANSYVSHDASLIKRAFKLESKQEGPKQDRTKDDSSLWDDWAQTRLDDALDRFLVETDAHTVPAAPFKSAFNPIRETAGDTLRAEAQQSLREALVNPGNLAQRIFLKLTRFLSIVLPLAAMGWVAYQVYYGFYQSSISDRDYLGTDFAVHSGLLILTAWLIPWFMHRKLRPATEKVAAKGLKAGIDNGLNAIEHKVADIISKTLQQRKKLVDEGQVIAERCTLPQLDKVAIDDSLLSRMLLEEA